MNGKDTSVMTLWTLSSWRVNQKTQSNSNQNLSSHISPIFTRLSHIVSVTKNQCIPWQYFPMRVYLSLVHSCPKATQLKSFEDFCWPSASTAKKPRKSSSLSKLISGIFTTLLSKRIFKAVAYLNFDGEEKEVWLKLFLLTRNLTRCNVTCVHTLFTERFVVETEGLSLRLITRGTRGEPNVL